jgi:hypothetical protein
VIDRLLRRSALALVPFLLVACGDAGSTVEETLPPPPAAGGRWTLDASAVESLPLLALGDSRILCIGNGTSHCPIRQAIANRLDAGHVALWEPGRPVQVWGADSSFVDVGSVGQGEGEYQTALAVGPRKEGGYLIVDLTMSGVRLMAYDRKGKFIEQKPLPPIRVGQARGFAGKVPLLQGMVAGADTGTTVFQVHVLSEATDSSGRLALEVPIPWLSLQGDQIILAPPLFVSSPVYSLLPDGEIVWSPGGNFEVSRRMADGSNRWELRGAWERQPITATEIATKRASMRQLLGNEMPESDLDSMTVRSEQQHPAIAGMLSTPEGTVYLAGPDTEASDSIRYIRLAPDGQPNGRFALPKSHRILLAAGDSVLVRRPYSGEVAAIGWARLAPAP